jgi:hypothetical protein
MSPLRKLLIAALLAVVLAQAAAMALLVRSQVQKAELREVMESTASRTAASPPRAEAPDRDGAMQVRYVSAR